MRSSRLLVAMVVSVIGLLGASAAQTAAAYGFSAPTIPTFTSLLIFDEANGAYPGQTSLVQATDGNFYGTTGSGGATNYGTVFSVTSSGVLTTLYSFCAQANCADGSYPEAGLVQGTDGNLYGTTFEGGANGLGTVFKITSDGSLTTVLP